MRKFLQVLLTTCFFIVFVPIQMQAQMKIAAAPVNKSSAISLSNVFTDYSLFSVDTKQIAMQAKKSSDKIDVEIEFPGVTSIRLSLKENNILSKNYKLVTGLGSAKQTIAGPGCITYTGKLIDDAASNVYLTITNHTISGFFRGNGKEYFIEPLKNFNKNASHGTFVLYEAKDVLPKAGTACALSTARQKLRQLSQQQLQENRTTISCKKIELALAADESMFIKHETLEDVQAYILSTINNMIGIFNNAQIGTSYLSFTVNGLYIATSAANEPFSPAYNGVEAMTMLTRLSSWGEAGNFGFDYDVCQLWTSRDIVYEMTPENIFDIDGLAMNIGTICTPQKYNVVQDWNESASYRTALSAHEIAHCLGAFHDEDFGPYIMGNISLTNTPTTFSSQSLYDMNNYLSQVSCLSACNDAPIAKFSVQGATLVSGQLQICATNTLQFSDISFGEVTSISWTFQDGSPSTSTAENPDVYFGTPGLKSVKLTVSNSYGSSTTEQLINVIAIEEIPGSLIASATEVCANGRFALTYTGSDPSAKLEWFEVATQKWITGASVPVGNTYTHMTPLPGLSYEEFRIKTNGTPCIKVSNIVRVNYLSVPKPRITGADTICAGGTATLQVTSLNENEVPSAVYVWSPGGAATPSITVSPGFPTYYTATITASNGCKASATKHVTVGPLSTPQIESTAQAIVCAGTSTTLSFTGTKTVVGCTSTTLTAPLWPEQTINVSNCNGSYQLIASDSWAGEYSNVNVVAGKYYAFKITTQENLLLGDLITISNTSGNIIYATGIGLAYWKASFTGQIRYYIHKDGCIEEKVNRKRYIACSSTASSFGTLQWMPGGQTTDAITVSPLSNTVYSLTFINEFGCSATNTVNVNVGIGSLVLTTTNITCNSATLNWTSPLNPTQWELEYKSTANGSKWINVPVANASMRSVTVTGLKLNQNYQWHLRAKCGRATTPYSDLVLFKTLASCASSLTLTRSMSNEKQENERVEDDLKAVAMPNPSNTNFRVAIGGVDNLKEPVRITVTDMMGRVVETRTATAGQVILVGDMYRPGAYLLRLTQGNKIKQIKLIKVTD